MILIAFILGFIFGNFSFLYFTEYFTLKMLMKLKEQHKKLEDERLILQSFENLGKTPEA